MILSLLREAIGSLVKRRIDMRIVRFWRSTKEVLMCSGFGLPFTALRSQAMQAAGL
jgi:hypothetical protein